MLGIRFTQHIPDPTAGKANFENLLKLFLELLVHTNGDVAEALDWMNQLDREHGLADEDYGMGGFIRDLQARGYIRSDEEGRQGLFVPTARTEQSIRRQALEEVFGKLRRSGPGKHGTRFSGRGGENSHNTREYEYGDALEDVRITESLQNAQISHGIGDFHLADTDLVVEEREYLTQTSTVLMIDISHSMILYGEDRITPAKKVAMALAELITKRYPKDTLDILVFGNEAWPVEIKDLPYLEVGPFHTNTVAGLELAMDILRRRKTSNKQIFMVTDGKPTCLMEADGSYYKNAFGLDRRIVNRCLNLAAQCKRLKMHITTFMIAQDPYLQQFVREFTETNRGRAFFSGLNGLGGYVLEDFVRNRTRRIR